MRIYALNFLLKMATEGKTRARDNLTVDEVIEWVFADDDSEQKFFFSESDSDGSEGVSSENLSAEEIGTDNIHFWCFYSTNNTRKRLVTF